MRRCFLVLLFLFFAITVNAQERFNLTSAPRVFAQEPIKITQLPAATSATGDDLLLITDTPGSTPVSKKIRVDALFSHPTFTYLRLTTMSDPTSPLQGDIWLSGSTLKFEGASASFSLISRVGSFATNDCVKFDANGNAVSAGAPCGSGGGGANAVLNDQSNTYSTGVQDFGAATALKLPTGAGTAPTASGRAGYDSTANLYKVGVNGSTKILAFTDSTVALASALVANGTNCSGNNFAIGVDASGNAECAQPAFANLSGVATAGQLPATAVNAVTNDANVTGSIATQTLTLSWSGTLAKSRQNSATVYNDTANSYTAGAKQTVSQSASTAGLNVGALSTDPSSLVEGDFWYNAGVLKLRNNSATKSIAFLDSSITGNAATATALQNARLIYGNSFDGTAALAQIIASTFGGTGNGFTKFSGPTTSEKTFTLPDSDATLLYLSGPLGTPSSGTLTNATGLPVGGITGLGTGVGTFLGTPTSANFLSAISNETGSGLVVGNDTPTIITPSFTTGFTVGGAAASRKVLVGNGANFVPSTETYAVPGTSGNVLTSDGTNWTSAAPTTGANTSLSNLASVAINDHLIPATNGTVDLGSPTKNFTTLYAGSWENSFSNNLRFFGVNGFQLSISTQAFTDDKIWSLIDQSGTFVGISNAQTLTNKTITASSNILGGVTITVGSDATGDIHYRNSSGILTRLGIGSTGDVLTVAGGLPSWAAPAGGGNPFTDATAILKGSSDTSKLLRFEVDGFTASTTRVITPPDADTTLPVISQVLTITGPTAARTVTLPDASFTVARTDAGQTFTGTQAFGAITATGVITQTSASATAFESGLNGGTNPTFRLVNSTASAVTGIEITAKASGQGSLLGGISSATNERLFVRSKGVGTINFGPGSAGDTYWTWNPNTGSYTQSGGTQMGWTSSGTNSDSGQDAGFNRNGVGVIEVNNGTAGQWGGLKAGYRGSSTNAVWNGVTIGSQSTGTPAAGFGAGFLLNINSSTTADQSAAQLYTAWNVATHASRSSFVGFKTVSNASSLVDTYIGGVRTAVVTDNTALNLFEVALPTLGGASGRVTYTVYCTDGTEVQSRRGVMQYSAVNKSGTYTSETAIVNEAASVSNGTLTSTFAVTSGTNKITISITPDTSLASPTVYFVKWSLENLSENAISVL